MATAPRIPGPAVAAAEPQLDQVDLAMAAKIADFLESEAGRYLHSYQAAQWDRICEDAARAKAEPHWRAQQGRMHGYRLCWRIAHKLVERARAEQAAREQEKEAAPEQGAEALGG